ncbi:MAG: DNA repair protein RecN [Methylothermaceae bacteria B42]|nr:MAG: DNA repair protein RecN [Methylothermaceae bacteria B42]HHJ38692.1 DNA repair protein RecN [Methylothermaceae bacterium]
MLTALTIRDLAVVKSLDLEFYHGFTALTGETGAGKSILLTALGLALGERAAADIVRDGAEKAEIILEFDLSRAGEVRQWLRDNDLDGGDTCLIRRTVAVQGRSRAFLNDRPVSLQTLQNLARQLVEIHGQHAHLRLLQSEAQRRLLDNHAQAEALAAQLARAYQQWREASKQLAQVRQSSTDQALREDFLRFQIQEMEEAGIETLDYESLVEDHTRLANLDKILTSAQAQLHQLHDAETSVASQVDSAAREMESLSELAPEFSEVSDLLRQAQVQLEEAGHSLRRLLDGLENDPAELERLEAQLSTLHDLARKHRVQPEELPQAIVKMQEELHNITHQEEMIGELEQRCRQLFDRYQAFADELSQRRREHAPLLSQRISELMHELGMPHGQFVIDLQSQTDGEPRLEGWDRIEFLVTTNPGQPPRPLAKVASGGELSRLSLAIQVACGEKKPVPTLIFDEVDTGIGGGVAEIVGQRLRELGRDRQVLCVTHLPQVAAQAHHHLKVSKTSAEASSETQVEPLEPSAREQEIARMLGGVKITEQTLAHAQEMLRWAKE